MGKRSINAKQIVADIKAGKTDAELMESYSVSAAALQSLFKKLVSAGLMRQEEIDNRIPTSERTVNLALWKCPACGMPQTNQVDECPDCGVIVSKLEEIENQKDDLEITYSSTALSIGIVLFLFILGKWWGLTIILDGELYGSSSYLLLLLMESGPLALIIRSFKPQISFYRGITTILGTYVLGLATMFILWAFQLKTAILFLAVVMDRPSLPIFICLLFSICLAILSAILLFHGFRTTATNVRSFNTNSDYPHFSIDGMKETFGLLKTGQVSKLYGSYPFHVIAFLAFLLLLELSITFPRGVGDLSYSQVRQLKQHYKAEGFKNIDIMEARAGRLNRQEIKARIFRGIYCVNIIAEYGSSKVGSYNIIVTQATSGQLRGTIISASDKWAGNNCPGTWNDRCPFLCDKYLEIAKAREAALRQKLDQIALEELRRIEQESAERRKRRIQAAQKELDDFLARYEIDQVLDDGNRFIMQAAAKGDPYLTKLIIEEGADIQTLNSDEESALSIAVSQGHLDTVEVLLAHDADPNVLCTVDKEKGLDGTPLIIATFFNDEDIARLLLKAGADPLKKNSQGINAVGLANSQGYSRLSDMFMAYSDN